MRLLRRVCYILQQRKIEAELAEEIKLHREMSGGPSAMGNITRAREDARAVWSVQSRTRKPRNATKNGRPNTTPASKALPPVDF